MEGNRNAVCTVLVRHWHADELVQYLAILKMSGVSWTGGGGGTSCTGHGAHVAAATIEQGNATARPSSLPAATAAAHRPGLACRSPPHLLVVWPSYVQCQSCAASSPVIWACSTVSPDNKVDTHAPDCLQDKSEGGPFKGHMKAKVVYSENAAPLEVFSGMAPVCDE